MRTSTLCAHAGEGSQPPEARPHVVPIYQTASFDYPDAETAEAAADGRGYIYSRYGNPTEDALGRTLAALEGAEASLLFSSGMGAIAAALEALLGAGDHLVSVEGLYGGTHELITTVMARLGVTHTLAPLPTAEDIARAMRPETRAVYVESVSNPLLRVADLDGIAAVCRQRGVPLVVDATFATPLLQRPVERGATLSVHSATKYLGGHGDLTAGVVSGPRDVIEKVRRLRKFHGASPDPFAAWLVLRGVRTLALRVERQVASAGQLARALEALPRVERVWYPTLPSHPDHALARRMLSAGGAIISFEVAGGLDAARRTYDRLKLIARAASLGDVTSLMTHPARFSHAHVPADARGRAGITDSLLRVSVGIEDVDDLLADLQQALA